MKKNPEFYFQPANSLAWTGFHFTMDPESCAQASLKLDSSHLASLQDEHDWLECTEWRKVRLVPSEKYGILKIKKARYEPSYLYVARSVSVFSLVVHVWRRGTNDPRFRWRPETNICDRHAKSVLRRGMRLNTPYYLEFID